MDALYYETNNLIQETQQCFSHLNNPQIDTTAVENEILTKIATINANCDRLDVLAYKVPISQRTKAKIKVNQLKYDIRHLQTSLQVWQQKMQRREYEQNEREQLLNQRFRPNGDLSIDIDYSLQHHTSMNNAHRGVDEMLDTGNEVLGSLRSQKEKLKNARRHILDIGNTLGLSNHTMQWIEKRLNEDKYFMYGGMVITSLILGAIVYYFVL